MNRLLCALALSVSTMVAVPAFAQTATPSIDCTRIDINKYNPADLSRVQELCRSSAVTSTVAQNVTPDSIREWASLGKDFSTAITDTARGVGMVANEFVYTPVGIMIAFYFLWDKVGGIIIGIPLLIALWSLYTFILSRYSKANYDFEYTYVPYLWGAFKLKKATKVSRNINASEPENEFFAWMFGAIPFAMISAIIIGVLIF